MIYILNSYSAAATTDTELKIAGTCTSYDDHVLYGQITDNQATPAPVVGALVRASVNGTVLGYTYSGCKGEYMLSVRAANWPASGNILIEVVGSDVTQTAAQCAIP